MCFICLEQSLPTPPLKTNNCSAALLNDETGEEALRTEYLVSAVPLNDHYTITTPTRTAQPDGTVVNTKTRTSFLLLDSAHGNHRPHQMPTADLADQVVAKSPLALLVVRLQLNRVVKGAAGASSDVFDMAEIEDPEWVTPNDLAGAGANWHTALATWQAGGSDQGGCVALTSPKPVQNVVPLLSPQCPTYCLQVALRVGVVEMSHTAIPRHCLGFQSRRPDPLPGPFKNRAGRSHHRLRNHQCSWRPRSASSLTHCLVDLGCGQLTQRNPKLLKQG